MAIDGIYQIAAKTPVGEQKATLTLKTDGEVVSGSLAEDKNTSEISDGKVNGNDFEFLTKLNTPMGKMNCTFYGKVDGDKISGTCKTTFGWMTYEGVRA